MEQQRIEIGEAVVHKSAIFSRGIVRAIQLPIPGCEPRYYVEWNFCERVSGPISGLLIERMPAEDSPTGDNNNIGQAA